MITSSIIFDATDGSTTLVLILAFFANTRLRESNAESRCLNVVDLMAICEGKIPDTMIS
jgi:hypothetical protein